MITSRLASRAQTTIPEPVRDALHLQEGDEIAYLIQGDRVVQTKAVPPQPREDPFKTFNDGTAKPTGVPMPIFERWSVVKVPFPYTDQTTRQRRPALVVATGADLAAPHLL